MNPPATTRTATVPARRMISLILPVLALVVLAALTSAGHRAEAASVTIQVGQRPGGSSGNQFNASSVTVNSGDSVTFSRFAGTHDVQSSVVPAGAAQFSSPSPLPAGSPFTVTLTTPGVYTFFCTIHSDPTEATAAGIDASIAAGNMVGKIVVAAAAATATPTTAAPTATQVPPTATPTVPGPTATPGAGSTPIATPTVAPPTATPTATTPGSTPTNVPTATPSATATPPPPGPGGVNIIDFAFTPVGLTVASGTSVRWVNTGTKKHTVTADDSSFDSGLLSPGDAFTRTFAAAGAFTYYCDLHPEMTGTVTVTGGTGSSPTPSATSPAPTATATPSAPPPPAAPGTVQIVDFSFAPATMRVTVGATVRWENVGAKKHTATASDGSFDSGLLGKGDAFSHTFSRAGSFRYECDLHPDMTGEIQVFEASSAGTTGALWPTPASVPANLLFNEGWDPITQAWVSSGVPSLAQITSGNAQLWALILGQVRSGLLFARDLPPNIVTFVESQYARLGGPPASFYTPAAASPGSPSSPSAPTAPPPPVVPPGPGAVQIVDYDFSPHVLTVAAGSTVRFTNAGKARHTVTSNSNEFDSGLMVSGDSYSFTFSAAGSYEYFCIVHPDMTGTVEVVGTSSGSSPAAPPAPAARAAVPAPLPVVPGDVQVIDFDYSPRTITVVSGASVRFSNTGAAPHTVTARDGSFDSGFMARGDAFRHVFANPGTYQFFCDFHPQMSGTVVVLTATGGAPPANTEASAAPVTSGLPNISAILGPKVSTAGAKAQSADIVDFAYQPGSLSVARGTTVTWTNQGTAPHTVTTRDGAHDSGLLRKGSTYSITFDTNGTYEYFCTIHPDMNGTVTVADTEAAAAPVKAAPAAAAAAESVPAGSSHHSLALILALGIAGFTVLVVIGAIAAIGSSESKS